MYYRILMNRVSIIGSLLKKNYRSYSNDLLELLQRKGFIDLRPSFLEILSFVCENNLPTIKEVGIACGLKKQTMTSHLNELEARGYITRRVGHIDKRTQHVCLTDYGERFKINLLEVTNELEGKYLSTLGSVELDRVVHTLETFYEKSH